MWTSIFISATLHMLPYSFNVAYSDLFHISVSSSTNKQRYDFGIIHARTVTTFSPSFAVIDSFLNIPKVSYRAWCSTFFNTFVLNQKAVVPLPDMYTLFLTVGCKVKFITSRRFFKNNRKSTIHHALQYLHENNGFGCTSENEKFVWGILAYTTSLYNFLGVIRHPPAIIAVTIHLM